MLQKLAPVLHAHRFGIRHSANAASNSAIVGAVRNLRTCAVKETTTREYKDEVDRGGGEGGAPRGAAMGRARLGLARQMVRE